MATAEDPRVLIQRAKASQDVHAQLNLLERALATISPETQYQAAMLDALNETVAVLEEMADAGSGTGSLGATPAKRLDQIVNLLEQQVMGQVDSTTLPVGLEGEARVDITNGDTGLASVPFAGGRYSARVTAKEDIEQFDDIRIVEAGNLAEPVPDPEAEVGSDRGVERDEVFGVDVDAGEDILSQGFSPQTPASELVVSVTLDTAAVLQVRVTPDDADVDPYTTSFNGAAATQAIGADDLFEFEHHYGPSVTLNYRVDTDNVTVRQLRVVETIRS